MAKIRKSDEDTSLYGFLFAGSVMFLSRVQLLVRTPRSLKF